VFFFLIAGAVLGVVAFVAMLASATGSSKAINYLLSFLSIFAGVMSVHKLTELPPGFAHITTESELLLAIGLSSPSGPRANNTATRAESETAGSPATSPAGQDADQKNLPPSSPSLRRRCAGRVSTAVDASQDVWTIAAAYHSSLYRRWVETGAGFLLAEYCAHLRSTRPRSNSPAVDSDINSTSAAATTTTSSSSSSTTKRFLAAARNMLGLDSSIRRGGRTLGLACRQLPLPVVELSSSSSSSSSKSSSGNEISVAPLPSPWITVPKTSLNSATIHGATQASNTNKAAPSASSSSTPSPQGFAAPQHGGLDESVVGAGFALYYSTGMVPEHPTASTSPINAERPLSLTLAFVAPTEAAALVAAKSAGKTPNSSVIEKDAKKKKKSGEGEVVSEATSSYGGAPPGDVERAHAAAVLYRVTKCLVREAAEEKTEEEEEEASAADEGNALPRNTRLEDKKRK